MDRFKDLVGCIEDRGPLCNSEGNDLLFVRSIIRQFIRHLSDMSDKCRITAKRVVQGA